MPRKIYDILPPKVANKVEDALKELSLAKGRKRKSASRPVGRKKAKSSFPKKWIFIGGAVVVFFVLVYFYNTLPKATVTISPTLDDFTVQEKITANKSVNSIDQVKKIIPAQYIEEEKDGSQQFPATGSAANNQKASGTITVYNKYSPASPITLKVGTHFLSDSGKYFVSLTSITIPAMKGKTAGSVSVKVQAEETGSDYNIKASKFSVPKLAGTAYYYSIWAESTSQMTGGFDKNIKIVTKDNIQTAKVILTKKLLDQAEASLKSKLGADDVLLDGALSRTVMSASSDEKADSVADNFTESAKTKVSALVLKKQDLQKFVKNYVSAKLPSGKNLLEKSLTANYNPELVDLEKGKETIDVTMAFKTYSDIDQNGLISAFSKKSADEIKNIVEEKYGGKVSQVKVDFWPFWVHSAPSNQKRIIVNLNY